MNILMTGATGYIGEKIIYELKNNNYSVTILIRKSSMVTDIKEKVDEVIVIDDYDSIENQLEGKNYDVYINLCGYYIGNHKNKDILKLFDANAILPTYVTDAFIKNGGKYIIHTSSYYQCYNNEQFNPVNLYASTKRAYEDVLKYYTKQYDVCAYVLQLFDTYGADDTRNKVFNLVRRLNKTEELDMSKGEQKMYFCYIDDVVAAYIKSLDLIVKEKINVKKKYSIRAEETIELKTFVNMYMDAIGYYKKINWGKRPYMEREILNPTNYGEVLPGWKPRVSYKEGIRLCAEYDLKNE